MSIPKPRSPGIYTSEKDLSSVNRDSRLKLGIGGSGGSGGGVGPRPKSYPWILECGKWNDFNYWVDNGKWQDNGTC